jgi:TonB family protein
MFKFTLALLLTYGVPAAAIEACSVLNPIEIAATLRGPGVVVAFHAKTDQDHFHTCYLARISQAGSMEDNLKRFQSEAPLTLVVGVADELGARGFDSVKPQPETTDTEIPGIGDRAILRRNPQALGLFASQGSNFLILRLAGDPVALKREQDLTTLGKEAFATNFEGFRLGKYEVAERAIANDKPELEANPKNFALLLAGMRKFDDARIYNARAAAAHPDDSEILYEQGVIDWITSYQPRMAIRTRLGLSPAQPLAGQECANIRAANRDKVDEGIVYLSKAIKLRPDFGDAMAYLNLLYRERADTECDDTAAHAADLKTAGEWVDKSTAAKAANPWKNTNSSVLSLYVVPPVPGGQMGGVIGGIISSTPIAVPNGGVPQRVRVSQGVSHGLLVTQVPPVYPPLARQARIQGTVVLQAIIGKDGSIENCSLVSGHPMLVQSALDAVKKWKYKPYLLNQEPVEVDTQVEVNFSLSGP